MAGKRDELAKHIQRLCAQHGRTISIKPIKTERTPGGRGLFDATAAQRHTGSSRPSGVYVATP